MDADKEGYLRSETSLIQIFGRASRNIRGKVILYADKITTSMSRAIHETRRRREIQLAFNESNHITPRSIEKRISDILASIYEADYFTVPKDDEGEMLDITPEKIPRLIKELTEEMKLAANKLEFENAARSRDKIKRLRDLEIKYLGEVK